MKRNYKLQNTNYKQITNYNDQNYKQKNKGGMVIGEEVKRIEGFETLFYANSKTLHDYHHFAAFSADSVHLKKPSGGPKGLIGSPCHGVE